MINGLVDYISRFVSLDASEIDMITSSIVINTFKRGKKLLKAGMISNISYFNLQGCVRLYYLVDQEEKTTFFYTENQFITSIRSFTQREPADHYLECIEDTTLALIPYQLEQRLLIEIPKLETFARIVLENEVGNYQEMLSSYILSSPEQRYLNLLKTQPQLLQRVPLFQLASYIGVKPESLSRIRSRISKHTS